MQPNRKKILVVFGTRPEAIKLAPLIIQLKDHTDLFETRACFTGQHKEMVSSILSFFKITPDYDMQIMRAGQTLIEIMTGIFDSFSKILDEFQPDLVVVQGDTSTAFAAALVAYYKQIKIAHVEAGLRSFDLYSPFPEEGNRKLIGQIADFHFTPTENATRNLNREGHVQGIYQVGNTVIDALYSGLQIITNDEKVYVNYFEKYFDVKKKLVLITGHRRESFGDKFIELCDAIKTLATKYPELNWIYPVHLNPNVQEPVRKYLSGLSNVILMEPLDYPYLLWLLKQSEFVLTDSGGIQEEAPSLGKPVLVTRDVTERQEGIDAGTAVLVGTDYNKIIQLASNLIDDSSLYHKMATAVNPYGDGTSSAQIIEVLSKHL